MALDTGTTEKCMALSLELEGLLAADALFWDKQEAVTPEDIVEHLLREKRRRDLRTELDKIQFPQSVLAKSASTCNR
jgi:hypothetical protein